MRASVFSGIDSDICSPSDVLVKGRWLGEAKTEGLHTLNKSWGKIPLFKNKFLNFPPLTRGI